MSQRAVKLVEALVQWRARDRKTQEDAAKLLAVARKTYILFEAGAWLPPVRERHFFAHTLDRFDPSLGEAFARACDTTAAALGITRRASAEPAHARVLYDAAVYTAAEHADIPAKTARALVAAVIDKLDEGGVSMAQAAQLGRREPRRPAT